MSIPRYQVGEKLRIVVEGTVSYVRHAPCEAPFPGALTIAVPTEDGGTYDVTVPLGAAKVERLAPTVLPREVWGDRDGDLWFAVRVRVADAPRTMMLPGEFYDLKSAELSALSPEDVQRRYGPITRVYPLPDADGPQPGPEGDEQGEPRLRLGDVWGAHAGAGASWKVVDCTAGVDRHQLALACVGVADLVLTQAEVTRNWGTLTLIERAGYRRTTDTAPIDAVARTLVVSCEKWEDDAPVTITGSRRLIADDACRLEVEYRPLGGDRTTVVAVDPGMQATLWDEIAGGAR